MHIACGLNAYHLPLLDHYTMCIIFTNSSNSACVTGKALMFSVSILNKSIHAKARLAFYEILFREWLDSKYFFVFGNLHIS